MARSKTRKIAPRTRARRNNSAQDHRALSPSKESIKAAEDLALAAFASGLKLAAAFGTVAAKTTSLALASIATGADKFSELVKKEAMRSQNVNSGRTSPKPHSKKGSKRPVKRELKREALAA